MTKQAVTLGDLVGRVDRLVSRSQLGHRLPGILEPILELAGQIFLDLRRVAGLALIHRPQAIGRAHHRHRPAEQVDMQALAFAQPVALLAHQLGPGLEDA